MHRRYLTSMALTLSSLVAGAPLAAASAPSAERPTLADVERVAVAAALERYRTAWLVNDPDRVVATFTADAVLLPDPASPTPIVGGAAIRAYWWPAQGPATTIVRFSQPVLSISGGGDYATACGTSVVAWKNGASSAVQESGSQWTAVLRRRGDGWRIALLSWRQWPAP